MPAHTPTLPDVAPHHWDSPEGREMAAEYSALLRNQLGHSALSDFALANAVFLVGRDDLRLINFQTSAKERIRWLSVQLVMAKAINDDLAKVLKDFLPKNLCLTNPNVPDSTVIPLEVSMGELRSLASALARAKGGEG